MSEKTPTRLKAIKEKLLGENLVEAGVKREELSYNIKKKLIGAFKSKEIISESLLQKISQSDGIVCFEDATFLNSDIFMDLNTFIPEEQQQRGENGSSMLRIFRMKIANFNNGLVDGSFLQNYGIGSNRNHTLDNQDLDTFMNRLIGNEYWWLIKSLESYYSKESHKKWPFKFVLIGSGKKFETFKKSFIEHTMWLVRSKKIEIL